ncbi:MAG: hypothetical protein AAI946_00520 [Candidatus Hodgkinia cicadicola]
MLIQAIKLASARVLAKFVDCACVLALIRACQNGLKLIVLKALAFAQALKALAQLTKLKSNISRVKYSPYTRRFDRTLSFRKRVQGSSRTNQLAATLGYTQVINPKSIHQIIIDANRVIKKMAPAHTHLRWRTLNFIIDKSASMLNKQRKAAQLIDAILAQTALEYEVCGYTTRHWLNSNAFKLWAQTQPIAPGRLNDMLYIRYGSDAPALKLACRSSLNKENIDGEAIIALTRAERVNIIINDNAPADYVTNRLNTQSILATHWHNARAHLLAKGIKLLVINLGQSELTSYACINLNKYLNKHRISGIINTILSLSAH